MSEENEVIEVVDDEGNAPLRKQQKIREDLIKKHKEQTEEKD